MPHCLQNGTAGKAQHYECTSLSSHLHSSRLHGWEEHLWKRSKSKDHHLLWIPGWWNRKLICTWKSWIIVLVQLQSMCCYSNRSVTQVYCLHKHEDSSLFPKPWKVRGSITQLQMLRPPVAHSLYVNAEIPDTIVWVPVVVSLSSHSKFQAVLQPKWCRCWMGLMESTPANVLDIFVSTTEKIPITLNILYSIHSSTHSGIGGLGTKLVCHATWSNCLYINM